MCDLAQVQNSILHLQNKKADRCTCRDVDVIFPLGRRRARAKQCDVLYGSLCF